MNCISIVHAQPVPINLAPQALDEKKPQEGRDETNVATSVAKRNTPSYLDTKELLNPGKGLGRIFWSEFDRTQFNARRTNSKIIEVAPEEKKIEIVKTVVPEKKQKFEVMHFAGLSQRPGKKVTVWLDNVPFLEEELPKGLRLKRNATTGAIIGIESLIFGDDPKDAPIIQFVSPGQYIHKPNIPME